MENINLEKLDKIKLSLLESKTDIDPSTGKADYILKSNAEFKINKDFKESLIEDANLLENLINAIYEDLLIKNKGVHFDTLSMSINYDNKILEKAININTLNDMKEYSPEDNLNPIHEFFKLTLDV